MILLFQDLLFWFLLIFLNFNLILQILSVLGFLNLILSYILCLRSACVWCLNWSLTFVINWLLLLAYNRKLLIVCLWLHLLLHSLYIMKIYFIFRHIIIVILYWHLIIILWVIIVYIEIWVFKSLIRTMAAWGDISCPLSMIKVLSMWGLYFMQIFFSFWTLWSLSLLMLLLHFPFVLIFKIAS